MEPSFIDLVFPSESSVPASGSVDGLARFMVEDRWLLCEKKKAHFRRQNKAEIAQHVHINSTEK